MGQERLLVSSWHRGDTKSHLLLVALLLFHLHCPSLQEMTTRGRLAPDNVIRSSGGRTRCGGQLGTPVSPVSCPLHFWAVDETPVLRWIHPADGLSILLILRFFMSLAVSDRVIV